MAKRSPYHTNSGARSRLSIARSTTITTIALTASGLSPNILGKQQEGKQAAL